MPDVSGDDWEEQRQALLTRELSLAELLAGRGLALRSDLLRPFAHWITPPVEPRRYDTKFFAAALPVGQEARHVSGEADEADWLTPTAALAELSAGARPMLPPTIAHPRPARAVPGRRGGAGRFAAGAAAPDQPDVREDRRRHVGGAPRRHPHPDGRAAPVLRQP